MADEGKFSFDQLGKACDSETTRKTLARIASVLGCPASDFNETESWRVRASETHALVTSFDRITDSQIRAKCIAFVTAEAARAEIAGSQIQSGELAT